MTDTYVDPATGFSAPGGDPIAPPRDAINAPIAAAPPVAAPAPSPAAATPPPAPPPAPAPAATPPAATPPAPAETPPAEKPPEKPPEKSIGEQMVEEELAGLKAQRARAEAAAKRTDAQVADLEASNKRMEELSRKQMEVGERGSQQLVDLQKQQLEEQKNRPQTMMPTPPPHPHYTMPPGLFGGDNAPGNQWSNAMQIFTSISPQGLMGNNIMAIKAMTGWLDGWHSGEKEKFDLEYKNWAEQNNYIKEYNQTVRQAYTDKLEDNKLAFEVKKNEVEMQMMTFKDAIGLETLHRQGVEGVAKLMDTRDEYLDKMTEAGDKATKLVLDWEKTQVKGKGGLPAETSLNAAKGVIKGDYGAYIMATPTQKGQIDTDIYAEAQRQGFSVDQANEMITTVRNKATADQAGARTRAQTAERIVTRVEQAADELKKFVPRTLETVRKLDASEWPIVNRLFQAGQRETGNIKYNEALINLFDMKSAYTRAINPQGIPRRGDREDLESNRILDISLGPDALDAQMRQMWFGVNAALQSARDVRLGRVAVDDAFPGDTGAAPTPAATGGGTTAPPTTTPPPAAIDMLRAHPDLRSEFDRKYGAGAADSVLGGASGR